MPHSDLPYWLYNVPKSQWPSECPKFLLNVSGKDKRLLSMWDADYNRLTWPEVRDLIRINRIDLFRRTPSDLRKYREYTAKLAEEYGSVMNFVLKERLQWLDLTPKGRPFSNPSDIKILYNDWPYGIDTAIVHLVIWTKFDLKDDPQTDDLTPQARQEIDEFVNRTFCSRVKPENVIWFKNWRSLRSVHAVEHFHVMLYDPDPEFVREITGEDIPLAAKVGVVNEI